MNKVMVGLGVFILLTFLLWGTTVRPVMKLSTACIDDINDAKEYSNAMMEKLPTREERVAYLCENDKDIVLNAKTCFSDIANQDPFAEIVLSNLPVVQEIMTTLVDDYNTVCQTTISYPEFLR